MRARIGHILKAFIIVIAALILLLLLALYLPITQDYAIDKALASINGGETGIHITAGKVRLYPPFHLSLKDVTVMQQSDTMAFVGNADLRLSLLPLLKGKVGVSQLWVDNLIYKMGNRDSAMQLRAQVDRAVLTDAEMGLKSMQIDVQSLKIDTLYYSMSLDQTIDSLGATIPGALIDDVTVKLDSQFIDVKSFVTEGLKATYLTPQQSEKTVEETDTATSLPWTINVEQINIKADSALYGMANALPQPGLDMNYLQVDNVVIQVDSLYNRGNAVRVPVKKIHAHERCGLDMTLSLLFNMDSDSLSASNVHLTTQRSNIDIDFMMGMDSTSLPMPMRLIGEGHVAPTDVAMALPSMLPMMAGLPRDARLNLGLNINGLNDHYYVNQLSLNLPGCLNVTAAGEVANLPELQQLDGDLKISGQMIAGKWINVPLHETGIDKTINVPSLTIGGNVAMHRGVVDGNINVHTGKGLVALDARWAMKPENYNVELTTRQFPVDALLPLYGIGNITADVNVHGKGYNPMLATTTIDANVDIKEIEYNKVQYTDINMLATVADGEGKVTVTSDNYDAQLDLRARGNLASIPYNWTVNAAIDRLDLQALGMSDSLLNGLIDLDGTITLQPGKNLNATATFNVSSLDWHTTAGDLATTDIKLHAIANDSVTSAILNNHDMTMSLYSPMAIDSITHRLPLLTAMIDSTMTQHYLYVDSLQHLLPPFTLDLNAGQDNLLSNVLNDHNMGFTSMSLSIVNDSLLNMDADVMNFNSGETVVDTITARIAQHDNSLNYRFHIGNRPGTLDQWAQVTGFGSAWGNHASLLFDQRNINDKTGYRLGFVAQWLPDEIKVRVVPSHPIIGYKKWSVNDSNFISLNIEKKHFDANLAMKSDESSIHLYTEHDAEQDSLQEDLILRIKDIELSEWIAVNPFAPPISGQLSSDMRFSWGDKAVNGEGLITLANLNYDKQRVGTFDLGVGLQTNQSGTVRARASLMVDSIKTITAEGNLNDSTARNPFLLDFKMIHFPLATLNPFLPKDMARFSGTLNGTMDITGSMGEPIFNGYLDFDSTTINVPMLGTTYRFSENKIPMDSNIISFDNYTIAGANKNPLTINGTVDARHLTNILIDLNANARDMLIVNSKKKRNVQVYGKAYIDLDASIKGHLTMLDIDANLTVLENTNVTYIVTDASDNLTSRANNDMVKFVNFADTTVVEQIDSITPTSIMTINAILNIRQGSIIGVDLSTDGKNRLQLESQGTLNYNMNYMGDSKLTGRLNLNSGYVRYTPPFMSEKLFNFSEGSYISFNGNMLDPYMNIKAVDVLRANVQQEGQDSRLINFDVMLSITNTLDNLDVAFNLATNDDLTVANELQAMSPEQRANQAMNLLLYNVYTGPGTKASSSLNGNPLFSFLESKVNSWAANNIKGVDLSFGIDQYDRTVNGTSSTTTSYSYKMSKSLFNDRFKISIGGNYASDSDPDQNMAQNLINDISFEYDITPSGSMYVKIFRHTGYESILEGEVTQTGVGFVYKRKLRRLSDLFKPFYRRKTIQNPPQSTTAQ